MQPPFGSSRVARAKSLVPLPLAYAGWRRHARADLVVPWDGAGSLEAARVSNEIRPAKARYRPGMRSSPSGLLVATHVVCWRHETGSGHPERLDRLTAAERGIVDLRLEDAVRWVEAPVADRGDR